ncbi:hypothetical protein Enr13x_08620 [Stieleria neptunia]|uniref:Uncharacterized protein n=1 Tax=Stieleria neptunia TaxID=2527979 RepID=A0A518HJJ1_9BACT|nr:hypothetical protein [Stieleria neptunia]QDV41024.1 hypothetical protein Enr13x_08620 [Stieleria neptunia]
MKFDSDHLGPQGTDADDKDDAGSRYADVKAALFHNAYYLTWGDQGEPELPCYAVTLGRILRGILPRGLPWQLKAAAERTVDSGADLRWGTDRRGFRRLLHPNGVCLFGRWIIDAESDFSGYFRPGSEALIVARYSTCCTESRRGYTRSLSLVGKLYPTTDPDHADPLRTANFITQEDLGGERTLYINDAELRNAPDVTPWRRGWGTPILLISGLLFKFVDVEPAIRQLHSIAELGKPADEPTRTPAFMRLTVPADQPRIEGDGLDFRDEILEQLYDRGNSASTGRKLIFNIDVTNQGKRRGLLRQRWRFDNWQRIGRIEFDEAVASYNGDFVVHFHHPAWRTDRNDPNTTRRAAPPTR